MRRTPLWLTLVIVVLPLTACGAGGNSAAAVQHRVQVYRDSAGWAVEVPPGWHAVRFRSSRDGITATGVQLSNTKLPPPALIPGSPVQVNGQVLPDHGVGLIIATDPDSRVPHGKPANVPLPLPWPAHSHAWAIGSAPPGSPILQTLWFRVNGMTYVAAATIGSRASNAAQQALIRVIGSFAPRSATA